MITGTEGEEGVKINQKLIICDQYTGDKSFGEVE